MNRPLLGRPVRLQRAPATDLLRPGRRLRWTPLLGAALLLLAGMTLAVGVGAVALSPPQVLQAVWRGLTGEVSSTADTIVWQIRLPRVLLAAVVGASLALAGVAYQGVFRNPLADPYLLGVASGAGLGAAVALVFGASVPLLARGLPLVAFAFALASVALTLLLARQGGRLPLVSLILAGVVLGSCFTAATSYLMLWERDNAARVLSWLLGSFALSSWSQVVTLLPLALLAGFVTFVSARALNIMQLGEESALQLGLPLEAFKVALIVAATLATAAAVSASGIIGFVGLIVPHAVRLAVGPDHRTLIPLAGLTGALFLVLADLAARTVIAPAELPIGVVTALVGGPFFLYLLRRQRRLG